MILPLLILVFLIKILVRFYLLLSFTWKESVTSRIKLHQCIELWNADLHSINFKLFASLICRVGITKESTPFISPDSYRGRNPCSRNRCRAKQCASEEWNLEMSALRSVSHSVLLPEALDGSKNRFVPKHRDCVDDLRALANNIVIY